MIQTNEEIGFAIDEIFAHWCKYGPLYNPTICHNFHGHVFGDLFVNAHQDRFDLMCGLMHTTSFTKICLTQ